MLAAMDAKPNYTHPDKLCRLPFIFKQTEYHSSNAKSPVMSAKYPRDDKVERRHHNTGSSGKLPCTRKIRLCLNRCTVTPAAWKVSLALVRLDSIYPSLRLLQSHTRPRCMILTLHFRTVAIKAYDGKCIAIFELMPLNFH